MTTNPAPQLQQILQSLAALNSTPPAPMSSANTTPIAAAEAPPAAPMTEAKLFAQFRTDMRLAGLTVYDCELEVMGVPHSGPAVSVRDPQQATRATSLTLASLALAQGLWRMYPVLVPLAV